MLLRNGAIALALGLVLSQTHVSRMSWPAASLLMLWPTFGGHGIELAFLKGLRPRIPASRVVQASVRLLVWFAGGIVLAFAMRFTAGTRWPVWWLGGTGFAGIELVAHLALLLRGRPNFYDGLG